MICFRVSIYHTQIRSSYSLESTFSLIMKHWCNVWIATSCLAFIMASRTSNLISLQRCSNTPQILFPLIVLIKKSLHTWIKHIKIAEHWEELQLQLPFVWPPCKVEFPVPVAWTRKRQVKTKTILDKRLHILASLISSVFLFLDFHLGCEVEECKRERKFYRLFESLLAFWLTLIC